MSVSTAGMMLSVTQDVHKRPSGSGLSVKPSQTYFCLLYKNDSRWDQSALTCPWLVWFSCFLTWPSLLFSFLKLGGDWRCAQRQAHLELSAFTHSAFRPVSFLWAWADPRLAGASFWIECFPRRRSSTTRAGWEARRAGLAGGCVTPFQLSSPPLQAGFS